MKTGSTSPENAIGRFLVLFAFAILSLGSINAFAQTSVTLNVARSGHTATVLADGRVLVFGGDPAGATEATAEIVDVANNTSTAVSLAGVAPRSGHTATRLANGSVLIAGGSESGVPSSSTLIISPAGNASPGPNMASARSGHTAVYFSETNNVLFIGGDSTGTAEVLDVAAGTSQHAPSNMSTPRSGHSSIVMNDGRVLIVGGDGLNTAEIFNGSAFTPTGNAMTLARAGALLRVLPDGKVQIIGGNSDGSMEVYDPAIDTIGAYAHVIPSTDYCVSLQNGVKASQTRAALFGSGNYGAPFDRTGAATVELGSQALVIGGSTDGTAITPIASSTATVTTDKLDYAPGELATITGRGFGANETVNIVIHEDPKPSADHIERKLTATTDSAGNFQVSYQVEDHDLNLKFILNARGQSSGRNAQTTFTDGNADSAAITTYKADCTTPATNFNLNETVCADINVGISGSGNTKYRIQWYSPSSTNPVTDILVEQTGNGPFFHNNLTQPLNAAGTWTLVVCKTSNIGPCVSSNIVPTQATVTVSGLTDTTTTITCPASVTFDGTALTPCTAVVTGVNGFSEPVNVTYSNNTNAGTATATASYPGDSTHNPSTATAVNFTIDKAASTTEITCPTNVTYTGTPLTPCTVSVTGAGGLSLTPDPVYTNNTNAGTANASYSYAESANHLGSSDSQNFAIDKATANVVVTPYDVTYDGQSHTATATITGVNGETGATVGTVDLTGTTHTDAGTYNDTWTFTGGANYNDIAATSVTNKIAQAEANITVEGYTGVYDGDAHGATGTATGVESAPADLSSLLSLGDSFTNVPGGTANWTFAGNTNYKPANGSVAITISKANATCSVTGYTGTYDGDPHGATGSCTGVKTETLSGLDLGASFTNVPGGTANWTFTDSTGNYNNANGTAEIVINKANATIDVQGYTGAYDGLAHGATGTAKGVKNEDLGSQLNFGASFTNVPGGTVNWSFAGDGNYNAASGSVQITISKADATCTIEGYTGTYDGNAHGATGSCKGVDAGGAATGGNLDLGSSFTDVPGGTASWTFTGGVNYNNQSGTAAILLSKANATINVQGYSGVYDAQPHGATGTATGVKGESLDSLLNLGSSFTSVPGGTANWSFAGNGNYHEASGSAQITINKADAVCTINGFTGTYDATEHGATGSCVGVTADPSATGSNLNLGAKFTNVPGGTANWAFTGGSNYNDQSGVAAIVINKADANVTVTGYTGTYDAQAHGATGSASGVGGVDLSSSLNLGATYTDVPGGTANWTFTGGTNYLDESGSVQIVINKADATVNITDYTGVYDAQAHGVSGTATGVGGIDLSSGLNLGATYTNVPGGPVSWTFTGGTNYNNDSGTANVTITPAEASVSVSGYTGTYDAASHGASGTATGVGGVNLFGLLNLGASFTDVPGGTANWTFNSGGTTDPNYKPQSGAVEITISKADANVVVNGYTGTYDGAAHGATGTATGVGGVDVSSGLNLGASFTDVPGGTANWTFSGGTNYNDASGTAAIVINKATATINVPDYSVEYDGQPHGLSGTATGVNNTNLTASLSFGAPVIDVPGGSIPWNFNAGGNYETASGTATVTITPATASCIVTGFNGVYDGNAHGATGSCTGVGGSAITGLTIDPVTFTNVPGGSVPWTFANNNYVSQSGSAEVIITKATATISVTGFSGTYDGQPHGVVSQSAKGVNNEDLTGLVIGPETFTNVPGGKVTWTFTNQNYNDQNGEADVTINAATANCDITGFSGVYDGQPHGATGKCTGVGGPNDELSGLEIAPTTHTNVPGGSVGWVFANPNYENDEGVATVTITKKELTVTPAPQSITYGSADPTFTFGYAGFVAGEDHTNLTTQASCSVPGSSPHNAGTYPISCVAGTAVNYSFNITAQAVFTVNKANLLITASSHSIPYGSPVPTITPSYTGFVLSDNASSLTTQPSCSTTYTQGSLIGNYPSTCKDAASGNYEISYAAGTVTVQTIYCSVGFHSPIGGSVQSLNGGSSADPVRAFKLNSTIPIKFTLYSAGDCNGTPVTTGLHRLTLQKHSSTTDALDVAIDATPTDAATTGNAFRLTGTDWHYNLDTKKTPGITTGTWLVTATMQDGSVKTVWISIKK